MTDLGTRGEPRRTGDAVAIAGDYQHRARTTGPVIQRFWHAEKERLIRKFYPPAAGDVVVDVGCGAGVQCAVLASLGADTIGIDGNPAAIEYARATFKNDRLQFRHALIDELALPEQSVDRIYCFELIEHIYANQAVDLLRTFRRLLKPDGYLLLTTPNYLGVWPVIEFAMDRLRLAPQLDEAQHVTHYTARRLGRLFRDTEWRLVRMTTFSTIGPFVSPLSWRLATRVAEVEDRLRIPFGNLLFAIAQPR